MGASGGGRRERGNLRRCVQEDPADDAIRKLLNRLKFGTEGALFSLALVGAGSGLKKLRTPSTYGVQEYAETKLGRALQRFGITGLKPEGMGTKQILESVAKLL